MAEVTEVSDAQARFIEFLITPAALRAEIGLPNSIEALALELGFNKSSLYRWKDNETFKKEWDRRIMLAVGNPERVGMLIDRMFDLAMGGSSKHAEMLLKMMGKLQQGQPAVSVEVKHNDAREMSDEELTAAIERVARKELSERHLTVVEG